MEKRISNKLINRETRRNKQVHPKGKTEPSNHLHDTIIHKLICKMLFSAPANF